MKKSILLFVALFISVMSSEVSAQEVITDAQWQEDVRYLQTTVHRDFPFLFKKVTAEKWDAEVEKLYKAIPTMEDHEVMIGFQRIVSLFKYGHTDMGFRDGKVKLHKLPLNFYHFKDGFYIEGAHNSYKNMVGAKVISIEGIPRFPIPKALKY